MVHCYGLLYHVNNPAQALAFLRQHTRKMLFLETCVSFGEEAAVHITKEEVANPSQAYSGTGCRPTRAWVFRELKELFDYVYLPRTQPCHEEFPLVWDAPEQHQARLQRAIFIASCEPLENEGLTPSLVAHQTRHE